MDLTSLRARLQQALGDEYTVGSLHMYEMAPRLERLLAQDSSRRARVRVNRGPIEVRPD